MLTLNKTVILGYDSYAKPVVLLLSDIKLSPINVNHIRSYYEILYNNIVYDILNKPFLILWSL